MNEQNKGGASDVAKYTYETIVRFGAFLRANDLDAALYEFDALILNAAMERYSDDIDRLRKYHGVKNVDCYKMAGYLSYWICKMKPVRVKNMAAAYLENSGKAPIIGLTKKAFFINELFSIHHGLARINYSHECLKSNNRVVLCVEHYEAMAYSLKYSHTTGDMLTLFFEMVDKASSGAVGDEIGMLHAFRQLQPGDKKSALGMIGGLLSIKQQ